MLATLWRWPRVDMRSAARMWRRDAILFRRGWKRFVVPNFMEPVLYLLSIGLGLGLYVGRQILGVEYVEFIAPGLAAAAAMNGAVFEVTYNVYIKLRYAKLYDAVVTSPLEPEDVAVGEAMWSVTRSLMYGITFVLVMAVLGYVHSPLVAFTPVAVGLIGLCYTFIGLIVTATIPQIDLFSYFFTLFVTPMFLFSGIFFPIEQLPAALQPVAWFTPLHHGVELMRALCLTGNATTAAGHAVWLAVACAVLYPPAVSLLKRRLVV